jgi:predicted RNase H-like HicB family nuclease
VPSRLEEKFSGGFGAVGEEVAAVSNRVVIERDETGPWLARVRPVPGCHTHGRPLDQVRRRIQEALELWVDDARRAELQFEIRLPIAIKRELHRARTTRDRSARAQSEASEAVSRAARDLTQKAGLSLRDAAELLELSPQRVQQVLSVRPPGTGRPAGGAPAPRSCVFETCRVCSIG